MLNGNKANPLVSQLFIGGLGGGGGSLVPLFPCSLVPLFPTKFPYVPLSPKSNFFRFWCSLFPKISETRLLFPYSQLYFPCSLTPLGEPLYSSIYVVNVAAIFTGWIQRAQLVFFFVLFCFVLFRLCFLFFVFFLCLCFFVFLLNYQKIQKRVNCMGTLHVSKSGAGI